MANLTPEQLAYITSQLYRTPADGGTYGYGSIQNGPGPGNMEMTGPDGQTYGAVYNSVGASGAEGGRDGYYTTNMLRRDLIPGRNEVGDSYEQYDLGGQSQGVGQYQPKSFMNDYLPFLMLAAAGGATLAGAGAGAAGAGGVAGDAVLPGALGAGGSEVAYGSLIPGLEGYALPAAGGAAGAAGGPGSAGWGADLGMDGLAGATPAGGMGTTLTGTVGGGLEASGGGMGLLSGASKYLGPAATVLGGLAGSQGQKTSQTSERKTDPRVDPYLFGDGTNPGLLGYTQQLLARQMAPGGLAGYDQMQQVGQGLLRAPVAGNGFNLLTGRR